MLREHHPRRWPNAPADAAPVHNAAMVIDKHTEAVGAEVETLTNTAASPYSALVRSMGKGLKSQAAGPTTSLAIDNQAAGTVTTPTATTPQTSYPHKVVRPTAELWELHKKIDSLNQHINDAKAKSQALQDELAEARDARDKWRDTAHYLEAESQRRQRVWWGIGGLAAGLAVIFLTQERSMPNRSTPERSQPPRES